MPKNDFNLKTEVDFFSNVLIIDYFGELSTLLVDALLSRGCFVYYFGKESRENFYYLLGRSNFYFLNNLSEIDKTKKIDYIFYFFSEPTESEQASLLLGYPHSKILVGFPADLINRAEIGNFLKATELNSRTVVWDMIYGPRIKTGQFAKMFSSAVEEKTVVIPESPQKEVYPISANRLIAEIIRLIFSPDTEGKAYFLQTEKTSLSQFTSQIQKHLTEVSFVFSGSENFSRPDLKGIESLVIKEDQEERILETIDWFQRNMVNIGSEEAMKNEAVLSTMRRSAAGANIIEEEKTGEVSPKEDKDDRLNFLFQKGRKNERLSKEKTSPSKKILFGVFLFCLLFLIFFAGPLFLSGILGTVGIYKLMESKKCIDEGRFTDAKNQIYLTRKYLNVSRKIVSASGPFYSLVGLGKPIGGLEEALLFSQYVNNSVRLSVEAAEDVVGLASLFLNGEDVKWAETLGQVKANLSLAYEQASLAQSSLIGIEAGFKVIRQEQFYGQLKKYLPEMREIMLKAQSLVGILPKILGAGERKTYLILFQNNMEIRPTGGFIGSYGIVNLENGKLTSFEVFDVYQADGQLKGHVEPPAKLKEYLGEATWYLRDSNWDPKFSISAKNAQWFLDKEVQITADGTVAITLEVIKNLLIVLKEVNLFEYNEKINANNLFQKTEYYSELGTFPGSTQKKDFLGSLAKAMFEKIKFSQEKDLFNIGGAVFSSLEQKEILLYFNDQEAESAVSQLNWAGDIRGYQPKDDRASAFADYLFINEANVGINKANYFVKRKIDHEITLDAQGKVKETLEIIYENQSPSESWPAGPYKNYLRLYLPKGTKISSILTSDPGNPDLWLPFDLNLVDHSEEYSKSVFGFLINVPIKSKKKIAVSYELPGAIDLTKRLNSYLLMLQKQSGGYPSDYSLVFDYPPNIVPLRVIPTAKVGNQQLLITEKMTKDLIFQIDLAH